MPSVVFTCTSPSIVPMVCSWSSGGGGGTITVLILKQRFKSDMQLFKWRVITSNFVYTPFKSMQYNIYLDFSTSWFMIQIVFRSNFTFSIPIQFPTLNLSGSAPLTKCCTSRRYIMYVLVLYVMTWFYGK